MKIAIIGANGKTGTEVVNRALARGHDVRAGYYGLPPVQTPNQSLTILKCNATVREDVEKLLDGVDAVVLTLGHTKRTPPTMQADATRLVLDIMKEKGIQRIVSLTGVGVVVSGDKRRLFERIFNILFARVQAVRVRDGEAHHALIVQSDRRWTVFRAFKLTNGEAEPWSLKANVPGMLLTSRKTVAEAMVRVIEDDSHLSESPVFAARKNNTIAKEL